MRCLVLFFKPLAAHGAVTNYLLYYIRIRRVRFAAVLERVSQRVLGLESFIMAAEPP